MNSRTRGVGIFGWRQILLAVLTAVGLVFVFENRVLTSIRLLVPIITMPLWLALLICLVLGLVIGLGVSWRRPRH